MGRKYSDAQDDYPTNIPRGYSGGGDFQILSSQDQSNNPNRQSLDDRYMDDHIPNGGPVIQ